MKKWIVICIAGFLLNPCEGLPVEYVNDSFLKFTGALNNTRPDRFEKTLAKTAWWKDDASAFMRSDGVLRCNGSQPATCAIMLPSTEQGQTIMVSALINPVTDQEKGMVHFGLSSHRRYVKQKGGQVWVSIGLPPGKDSGFMLVYGGDGRTKHLLTKQDGIKFDQPMTLSYNTANGNVEVFAGDVEVYDGPVVYNGLEGVVVPLENILCVGFEFDGVRNSDSESPAEISQVEITIE